MARVVPDGDRLQLLRSQLQLLSLDCASLAESPVREHLDYYLKGYGIHFQTLFPELAYTAGFLTVDGRKIFSQFWQQPRNKASKGNVFILHGYYDHGGLYGHIMRFFLEQGYSVFAFDEPGHGLSEGSPASIDSFSSYTKVLRQCLGWVRDNCSPQPFHLFGQSMGGAVITELLVGERCPASEYPIKNVILFAPLVRPVLWRWGRVQYNLARRFLKSIPRSRSNNSHDKEFLEFLASEPLQSKTLPVDWVGAMSAWIDKIEAIRTPGDFDVLIVQGQNDGTVDWRHNMPVYQRLYKSADIFYLPEGQHHLANESEDFRCRYFDWLEKKLDNQD